MMKLTGRWKTIGHREKHQLTCNTKGLSEDIGTTTIGQ